MASLLLIWTCTLGLAGATLATVVALVLRRLIRDLSARRDAETRLTMTAVLLAPDGNAKPRLVSLAAAQTLLGVLTLVRGGARGQIIDAALALGAPQALGRMLRRGAVGHRIVAAEALGFFDGEEVRMALRRASRDKDARVRTAALQSLLALGAPAPIADLLARMERARARRQSALAGVLRRAVAACPAEAVEALERSPLSAQSRIALIDALAAARAAEAAPCLIALAEAGQIEVRAVAIQALGMLGCPKAGQVVAAAMSDSDWRIRVRAAEAAGKLGLASLAGQLSQLLNDDVWWVRLRAGQALEAAAPNAALAAVAHARSAA